MSSADSLDELLRNATPEQVKALMVRVSASGYTPNVLAELEEKGLPKASIAGEYFDNFTDPLLANWKQAPSNAGNNGGPITGSGGFGVAEEGPLVFNGLPTGGITRRAALLINPAYYEEPFNKDKPLLSYYQAILSFTIGIAMPPVEASKSLLYGLRVLDTSNWDIDAFGNFGNSSNYGLTAQVFIEGKTLKLILPGYGNSESSSVAYTANNKNFWLRVRCVPNIEGDAWEFTVFDKPPHEWASEPTGDEGLLTKTKTLGNKGHRLTAASNLRVGMELKYPGIGAEQKELWEKEKGAKINYLRVLPLVPGYPNF